MTKKADRTEEDDIPEALREKTSSLKQKRLKPKLKFIVLGLATLSMGAIAMGLFIFLRSSQQTTTTQLPTPTSTPTSTPTPTPSPTPPPNPSPDNILGHLVYSQAPENELSPISPDGRLRLRKKAAEEFLRMQAAAKTQGVILYPISAFRTVEEQDALFFKVKEKLGEVATKRAEFSAPPGYSEHHTGYAIDIGDAQNPQHNLRQDFEKTKAFLWLKKNAAKYSFELSFSANNLQGIAYEPWHWRFVGDRHSLETFYRARNLKQPLTKNSTP